MRRLTLLRIGVAVMALGAGRLGLDAAAAEPAGPNTAGRVEFTRDVVPLLTRHGCNAGVCHGSFQGRGNFRLSLLGYEPAADFEALVKESRGRRVALAAPDQSMILKKPAAEVPHGGGLRFAANSPQYQLLKRWIESGAPGPAADEARLDRIEISVNGVAAAEVTLKPGEQAQLSVRAFWSDGVSRDVTPLALFDCRELEIAEVDDGGAIRAVGRGRTAAMVRFGGHSAAATVTVPYEDSAEPADFSAHNFTAHNFIDEIARDEWRKVGVRPAPPCDDATFLRRASLDLTGTLPTPEAVRVFVVSSEPDKRSRLIDDLLARPEYVDFWSLRWSDLLRAHRRTLGEKGLASFRGWLKDAVRENRPADAIVRELLTARGNLYTSGPVAFYFVDQTPQDLAETTAQVFLGVRLQCARCHHHPFEKWSQENYFELAAFFARVVRKDTKESGQYGGAQAVLLDETAVLAHPKSGAAMSPRVLAEAQPAARDAEDPRGALADWITSPDNPYFARNLANRYWGYLFGRGIVHPIDDLRETNPATHPKLLDALARHLVESQFDLKHLLRTICNSRVYQLAAELEPTRDADGSFLTHHVPRQLPAEVLLDAVNQVAGADETFVNLPVGVRAIALDDPAVESEFLDIFGRPKRTTTCLCERIKEPDLRQALHLTNNEQLSAKIAGQTGRVAKLLAANLSDKETTETIYLAALGRLSTEEEIVVVDRYLKEEGAKRDEVFQDLMWTLINCAEFSFSR